MYPLGCGTISDWIWHFLISTIFTTLSELQSCFGHIEIPLDVRIVAPIPHKNIYLFFLVDAVLVVVVVVVIVIIIIFILIFTCTLNVSSCTFLDKDGMTRTSPKECSTEFLCVLNHQVGPFLWKIFFNAKKFFLVICFTTNLGSYFQTRKSYLFLQNKRSIFESNISLSKALRWFGSCSGAAREQQR